MAIVYSEPVVHERHVVHHDDDSSSAISMVLVVLLVAGLFIGFLLFATGNFPFNGAANRSNINVEFPSVTTPYNNTTPNNNTAPNNTDTTPDVNVN